MSTLCVQQQNKDEQIISEIEEMSLKTDRNYLFRKREMFLKIAKYDKEFKYCFHLLFKVEHFFFCLFSERYNS